MVKRISLNEHEQAIVIMSLRHFLWRAEQQVNHARRDLVPAAAWYATTLCIADVKTLLDKMEKTDA